MIAAVILRDLSMMPCSGITCACTYYDIRNMRLNYSAAETVKVSVDASCASQLAHLSVVVDVQAGSCALQRQAKTFVSPA